jgi:sulfur-oxidizing protein SoxA
MEALQGLDAKAIAATPFGRGEQANMEALAAYVSAASRGMKFNLPQATLKEREMFEVGKRVFFFRGGPYDFSCASCHGEAGKRIRLQDLPDLTKNPATASASPPGRPTACRSGEMWSMQRRLYDCYRQQRFPYARLRVGRDHRARRLHGVNARAPSRSRRRSSDDGAAT